MVSGSQSLMKVHDLGPLLVEIDGVTRPPGGRVLERLLARLLVDANRPVDQSGLVEAV